MNSKTTTMNLLELGYVAFTSAKLDEWETYGRNVLGLMAVRDAPDRLTLRTDDRACRLVLNQADTEGLVAVGWLVADEPAFFAAVERLKSQGLSPTLGTRDECFARKVSDFAWILDPMGNRHEIAWGPSVDYRSPFSSQAPNHPFGGRHGGLGHVVLSCDADKYQAYETFAHTVLGLAVSNFRRHRLDDGQALVPLTWFHCQNDRHHAFAIAAVRNPHPCQHIMLQVATIDDVGRCHDRCTQANVKLASTFGRHVNDHVFSFYMVTPSGFWIEYGAEAQAMD